MEGSPAGQGPSKSSNSEFLPFKANIPLYVQTTSRLCTHPRMDPWVASAFWLRESAAKRGWAGVCLEFPLSILFLKNRFHILHYLLILKNSPQVLGCAFFFF